MTVCFSLCHHTAFPCYSSLYLQLFNLFREVGRVLFAELSSCFTQYTLLRCWLFHGMSFLFWSAIQLLAKSPAQKRLLHQCHISHSCDKVPSKSNLKKEGFFYWLTYQRYSPLWRGCQGGRSLKQLVTLHLQSGRREQMNACAQLASSFLCSPGPKPREQCHSPLR